MLLDDRQRRLALALRRQAESGRQKLDGQKLRLPLALKGRLDRQRVALVRASAALDAMSPLKVLGRGYAIARRGEDVISSAAQAQPGDRLEVLVSDGALRCEVKEVEEGSWR